MKKKIIFVLLSLLFLTLLGYSQEKGLLRVITNPPVPDAEVFLDGNKIGELGRDGTKIWTNIGVGTHQLRIRKQGYNPYIRTINIDAGLTHTESISLNPISYKRTENITILKIECNIGGADVIIDGKKRGVTTFEGRFIISNFPVGRHRIKIEKKNYRTFTKNINITEKYKGTTYSLTANLSQKTGDPRTLMIVSLIVIISIVVLGLIFVLFRVISSFKVISGRFDQYSIKELVGRGGMSNVYKAQDMNDKKEVALKIMDDRFLKDRDLINKFRNEGKGLSLINQKYPQVPVVKIFRFGKEDSSPHGRPFLAMEFLKGPSLLSLINKKKKFTLRFIINVIKQTATALDAAHSVGIFHRDLSPDNIIVTKNSPNFPLIKLIDFGVAKHEYVDVGTLDGTISGKPPYMSPEQCRGKKVDARSDIYSLGIIFYALLTGNPPFASQNPLQVMHCHEKEPVPGLPNTVPETIRRIVYKMLSKDKKKRFQTMKELIEELSNQRI